MIGPGKYDAWCTRIREQTHATGVILLVMNGEAGSGFSIQTTDPELDVQLPSLLRRLAQLMEEEPRERIF